MLLASVLLLFQTSPTPFRATLTETGVGSGPHCPPPSSCPTVNLSLQFTSPSSLNAQNVVLKIDRQHGSIRTWNGTYVASVNLTFDANSIAHWMANFGTNQYWSGFTATLINPDDTVIGGATTGDIGQNTVLHSSVSIELSLPYGSSVAGFDVVVSTTGNPGFAETTLEPM